MRRVNSKLVMNALLLQKCLVYANIYLALQDVSVLLAIYRDIRISLLARTVMVEGKSCEDEVEK